MHRGLTWKSRIVVATVGFICVAVSLLYAHSSGRQYGMQVVQTLWTAEMQATIQAHAQEMAKARQTEQALQDKINQLTKEHRDETRRIAARHAAIVDGLRNRPETRACASGVPEGASAGIGCTGAGLSRFDSEFLVWVASEADRTQAALGVCIRAYEEVRRALNGTD